ncbi:hypothetical protein KIW84_076853 [Lathyrus oleraceus]|uniref:Uncharacterized protein n=1 Tax=Pisum sativum TaxID=3888 RepID=A0A9D4VZD9_PEA|nr:hypothetical protein KIW84_076853 [Pisum sativum]
MAPKFSGFSKKEKTGGSTSRQPRQFDATYFRGAKQKDRFRELEKRKIWSKKKFNINRKGYYREVHETLTSAIDDLYVVVHCMAKKKKSAGEASSFGNLNFQDWDLRQKVICNYNWYTLEVN